MGIPDRGGGSRLGGGEVRIQEGWIHASAHLRPASAGMTGGDDEGGWGGVGGGVGGTNQ